MDDLASYNANPFPGRQMEHNHQLAPKGHVAQDHILKNAVIKFNKWFILGKFYGEQSAVSGLTFKLNPDWQDDIP